MNKVADCLKFLWMKSNRFHKVILLFAAIEFLPLPEAKYGFHCKDPALSYPFNGDTISTRWLMSVCLLLPLATMLTVERVYQKAGSEKSNRRVMRWFKEYLFGYFLNLAVTQVIKVSVGSPRPHFFDTCQPEEASNCEGSQFISSYTCSGPRHWKHQSDKSFPSGHTSLGLHAGLFIAYYLHRRAPPSAAVRSAQALVAATAVWCGASRITDHRHHWWDVMGGVGVGIAVLLYTIQHLCRNFECSTSDLSDPERTTGSNGHTYTNAPLVDRAKS